MVKKWTIWIVLKLWAFVLFIVSIVEDLSTFLREDGKGSAFSSRRLFAVTFVVSAVYSISLAIRTFADLLRYGWIAALVFIPVVICGVFAAIFSYYASSKDFDHTISAVGTVVQGKADKPDISMFSPAPVAPYRGSASPSILPCNGSAQEV